MNESSNNNDNNINNAKDNVGNDYSYLLGSQIILFLLRLTQNYGSHSEVANYKHDILITLKRIMSEIGQCWREMGGDFLRLFLAVYPCEELLAFWEEIDTISFDSQEKVQLSNFKEIASELTHPLILKTCVHRREENKLVELNDTLIFLTSGEAILETIQQFSTKYLLRKQYRFHVIDVIRYVISCVNYHSINTDKNENNSNNKKDTHNKIINSIDEKRDNLKDLLNIPKFSVKFATAFIDYFLREPTMSVEKKEQFTTVDYRSQVMSAILFEVLHSVNSKHDIIKLASFEIVDGLLCFYLVNGNRFVSFAANMLLYMCEFITHTKKMSAKYSNNNTVSNNNSNQLHSLIVTQLTTISVVNFFKHHCKTSWSKLISDSFTKKYNKVFEYFQTTFPQIFDKNGNENITNQIQTQTMPQTQIQEQTIPQTQIKSEPPKEKISEKKEKTPEKKESSTKIKDEKKESQMIKKEEKLEQKQQITKTQPKMTPKKQLKKRKLTISEKIAIINDYLTKSISITPLDSEMFVKSIKNLQKTLIQYYKLKYVTLPKLETELKQFAKHKSQTKIYIKQKQREYNETKKDLNQRWLLLERRILSFLKDFDKFVSQMNNNENMGFSIDIKQVFLQQFAELVCKVFLIDCQNSIFSGKLTSPIWQTILTWIGSNANNTSKKSSNNNLNMNYTGLLGFEMEKILRGAETEFYKSFDFNILHCILLYKMCEIDNNIIWITMLYDTNKSESKGFVKNIGNNVGISRWNPTIVAKMERGGNNSNFGMKTSLNFNINDDNVSNEITMNIAELQRMDAKQRNDFVK